MVSKHLQLINLQPSLLSGELRAAIDLTNHSSVWLFEDKISYNQFLQLHTSTNKQFIVRDFLPLVLVICAVGMSLVIIKIQGMIQSTNKGFVLLFYSWSSS